MNISFQNNLLAEIDAKARKESRTRSELLREAARLYIRRQKQWDDVFALGDRTARSRDLSEADVVREVQSVRKSKPRTSRK